MSRYLYVDASALVKLAVDERESEALERHVSGARLVSADIVEVELHRAVARREPSNRTQESEALLDRVLLVASDPLIRRDARRVPPTTLRSLDAIHLATALRVAHDLDAFVCYDERLCAAARDAGLEVVSPSD